MELLLYLYYIFLGAFALALLTPLIVGLIALVGMFVVAIASNRTLELLLNNVLLPVWSYEAVKMAYLSYKSGALGDAFLNLFTALIFFAAIVIFDRAKSKHAKR